MRRGPRGAGGSSRRGGRFPRAGAR
jgi:hypothetical protein